MLLALWPALMPMLESQVKEPRRIIYPMYKPAKQIEEENKREEDEILMLFM
jgi:hypothetical protein